MDHTRTRTRSRTSTRGHPAALPSPSSPLPMPEPAPAPFAHKSVSLRIMSILPTPTSLPSPTSSPGTQFQTDIDLDADALLHDSLFSLSYPVDGPSTAVAAAAATTKPPLPPASPTTSNAFTAPFPPAALYDGAAHHYHQPRSMPIPHRHHHHHGTMMDMHSPFSTIHLPPSPAPSESSAYTSSFPDADCHSPKAVPSPTLGLAAVAATPDLQQPHIDLASISTFLDLPARLTQLARSALDTYPPASRPRYSNNQLIAAAIICAARALKVNLSMSDTVKACGLGSVNQVRPVVSDLRRRSEALVVLESESDTESAQPPPPSALPQFVGVEVPLSPPSQGGSEQSPRRPVRVGSASRRPAPPPKSAAPSSPLPSFSHLTPTMVSALAIPPEAYKHIEHVFRTSKQQIKLRRGIKGGKCGDESILGGAIFFVGKRLGLYPVSQAKVAEVVGRTPTTVKGMFDRMCGMGDDVVPSELRGQVE